MQATVDDFLHLCLVPVFLVEKGEGGEQAHLHLLGQRESCGMVQCNLSAVGHHAVNKLHLLGM